MLRMPWWHRQAMGCSVSSCSNCAGTEFMGMASSVKPSAATLAACNSAGSRTSSTTALGPACASQSASWEGRMRAIMGGALGWVGCAWRVETGSGLGCAEVQQARGHRVQGRLTWKSPLLVPVPLRVIRVGAIVGFVADDGGQSPAGPKLAQQRGGHFGRRPTEHNHIKWPVGCGTL